MLQPSSTGRGKALPGTVSSLPFSSFIMLAKNLKLLTVLFVFHHIAPSSSQATHSLNQGPKAGPKQKSLYSSVFGAARHLDKAWTALPEAPQSLESSQYIERRLTDSPSQPIEKIVHGDQLSNPNNRCSSKVWFAQLSIKVFKFAYSLTVNQKKKSRTAKKPTTNQDHQF